MELALTRLNNPQILAPILAITIAVSFFWGLGNTPLFDEDEGAFSEATREMLETGDYIITHLNGKLRFDKPILIYWLQAGSVKLLGLNEFALRAPSAIAATCWALLTFFFARRFFDLYRAFLSTFFLVTALQVTTIGKAAIADAALNLFIAGSMFAIFLFYRFNRKGYLLAAFAFCALGALTKGPVAILVPFSVSFIFFLWKGALKRWLKAVFDPLGIALFLAITLPWYIMAYQAQGQAFIDGFFLKHNLERFQTPFEGHAGSLVYYFPVVLAGLLPYTALLFVGARRVKEMAQNDLYLYCGLWFAFVFVFFSLSGTKLPHYVIYGYTPLFLLMPLWLERVSSKLPLLLPAIIALLLLLLAPLVIPFALDRIRDEFAAIVISAASMEIGWPYWACIGGALAAVIAVMLAKPVSPQKSLLITGFVFMVLVNVYLMPLAGRILQQPVKEAAMIARSNGYDVVMWKINVYSFLVYTQKKAPQRRPMPGEIVLTKSNKLRQIKSYDVLFEKNGVALAKVNEVNW